MKQMAKKKNNDTQSKLYFSKLAINGVFVYQGKSKKVIVPANSAFILIDSHKELTEYQMEELYGMLNTVYGDEFKETFKDLSEDYREYFIKLIIENGYFFRCVLEKDIMLLCKKEQIDAYFTNIMN